MAFLQKLRQLATPRQSLQATAPDDEWVNLSTGNPLEGLNWGNKLALIKDPAVYGVITRLSDTMASLPIGLYDSDNNLQQTNSINNLVSVSPNPNITAYELWNRAETDCDQYGNAYILVEVDDLLRPVHLWNIPYSLVTPTIDSDSGLLYYLMSPNSQFTQQVVPADWMIHFKHISGSDLGINRLEGISPLDVLQGSANYAQQVEQFSMSELSKRDGFTVTATGTLSRDSQIKIAKQIKSFVQQNTGVIFSDDGIKTELIDRKISVTDAQENDDKFNKRVANAFVIPLIFVNVALDSSAAKNTEELMDQYVQMSIIPRTKQWIGALNKALLTQSQIERGYSFQMDTSSLTRGNSINRAAYYQAMKRNGNITTNEARVMEGLPKSKEQGADQLFISNDVSPIVLASQTIASGTSQSAPIVTTTTTQAPQSTQPNNGS